MSWIPYKPPSAETDTVKVGTAVRKIAKSLGLGDPGSLSDLQSRWHEIAGDELASHVIPVNIVSGVLYVEIADPAWRASLRWISPALVTAINDQFSGLRIQSIKPTKSV